MHLTSIAMVHIIYFIHDLLYNVMLLFKPNLTTLHSNNITKISTLSPKHVFLKRTTFTYFLASPFTHFKYISYN